MNLLWTIERILSDLAIDDREVDMLSRDTVSALAGSIAALLCSTSLFAADLPSRLPEPAPSFVAQWNPWQIRVRALVVLPDSGNKVLAGGARVPGGKVDIDTVAVPELDISYFFNPNIAVELILGTSWHDAKGAGSLASLGKLGHTYLLPPTLTLQYHFTQFGAFRPYIGAGINYSIFYAEDDTALTRFKVSNTVGAAFQVGMDYMINDHWGVNVDLKKLFLSPVAKGYLGSVPVRTRIDLDPWLVGTGITYKF